MSNVAASLSKQAWLALKHPRASEAILLTGSLYLSAGLGFLEAIIAARMLGPSEYGVAVLAIAYPTLLWSLASVKSVSAATRYVASFRATGQEEQLRAICKLGFGLDFLAALVTVALVAVTSSWVAQNVYRRPESTWLMIAYAASFPFFSLVGTSGAILSSWQKFRWLAAFQVLEPTVKFASVVSFLLAGFGAPGVILGAAFGQAVAGLAMGIAATYVPYRDGMGVWWKAQLDRVRPLRQELVHFFGWNYLLTTLSGLMALAPLMMLGRLRSPSEAGFFRLSTSLMTIGSSVESSLGRIAYPTLSARWGRGERKGIENSLKQWTRQGGLLSGGFILLAVALLPFFVPLLFGPQYRPMVRGAQLMLAAAAVSATFFWLNPYYYASGRIRAFTLGYGVFTVLALLAGWFSIQRWGFLGMAAAAALGKALFTCVLANRANREA